MNRIFNKVNGILFAGLLGGVLVAGLGAGLAAAEYMGFEYDDASFAEGQTLTVTRLEYELAPDERVTVPAAGSIVFDESVPAGMLYVDVEHNPELCLPEMYADSTSWEGVTHLIVYQSCYVDDFEMFMKNKDVILQGLKEGKLVAIDYDHSFNVTVSANPADQGRIGDDPSELYAGDAADVSEVG